MRLAALLAVVAVATLAGCGSAPVGRLPPPPGPARDVARLAGGRSVVLLAQARSVELRDASGRRLGRAPAGLGPSHVACLERGARAWCYVTDTRGEALLVFAVGSRIEATRRLGLPGDPTRLAVDPRRALLRVTLSARHELVVLPAHGRPHVLRRAPLTPRTGLP